jgi:hypothetical protein
MKYKEDQVGQINEQFLGAGGNVHEYMAAVRAAIDLGYVTVHPSGAYLPVLHPGRRGPVCVGARLKPGA